MGWHSSSNAYTSLTDVTDNVNAYFTNKIPLEGVWLDIPYMAEDGDFSVNSTTFSGLKDYANNLKLRNQKMMVILTPGLQNSVEGNTYISMAKSANALLNKMNSTEMYNAPTPYSNDTVFLDWFNKDVNGTWWTGIKNLYD
jgi:alpha-glucosidase (family GH31 glycosyl hydrolase)